MAFEDDGSDTASLRSLGQSSISRSVVSKTAAAKKQANKGSTVAKLRPKPPVILSSSSTILEVSKAMANGRTDSVLLTGGDSTLAGIVTSTDMMRKVVALGKSPTDPVSGIMTPNPKCVSMDDDATEALIMMMDNHFRHLPVLDSSGSIVAVLDIAKCMYDAITKIEKLEEMGKVVGASANASEVMMKAAMKGRKGMNPQQVMQMQAMLGPLMESMFGGASNNLGGVLAKRDIRDIVSPEMTVRDAAKHMASIRKGVAVADVSGSLVGVFTLKDLNNRVLAKDLSPDTTLVSEVMTANPESVESEMSLLDALHFMHDRKYNNLPVAEGASVVGLVDAVDLMTATMGDGSSSDGWRSFWESTMAFEDDGSDTVSVRSASSYARDQPIKPLGMQTLRLPPNPQKLRLKPMDELSEQCSQDLSGLQSDLKGFDSPGRRTFEAPFTFKIEDPNGNLHKFISASENFDQLVRVVSERLYTDIKTLKLKYKDEDGDEVLLTTDASLAEAVDQARAKGDTSVRVRAEIDESNTKPALSTDLVSTPTKIEKAAEEAVQEATQKAISSQLLNPAALKIGAVAAIGTALLGVLFFKNRQN